jgi:crossover junction endodeoxyribonuclease RuvC
MRILGVDPGTLFTGFGLIDFDGYELKYVASGVLKIPPTKEIPPRLKVIYDGLDRIIRLHKPDQFALETAFYGKNIQSTLKIGYARGVSLLAATHNGLSIKEYSPREIKKSVVGNGAASKEQVQYMIGKLLALKTAKIKFDESDSLAAAVCHAFRTSSPVKKNRSWKDFAEANPERIIKD